MKNKYRIIEVSEGEFVIQKKIKMKCVSRVMFKFKKTYNWVYLTDQGFINTHWFNKCVKVFNYKEEAKEYLKEYLKYPIMYPEFKM